MAAPPLAVWLGDLLRATFPPARMAFAYGSGVFAQRGDTAGGAAAPPSAPAPMIDFVLAVDDPLAWHADNVRRNRAHYAGVASPVLGGARTVAALQRTGARVWYNAMVPVPPPWGDGAGHPLMKYGVVGADDLRDDLADWSSFYLSGRMQKPVAMVDGFGLGQWEAGAAAGRDNLAGALSAALLLLPERFTEGRLYETVAGLSYAGDFRMAIAEDPSKVRNIVRHGDSPLRFRALYADAVAANVFLSPDDDGGTGGGGGGGGSGDRGGSAAAAAAATAGDPASVLSRPLRQDVSAQARLGQMAKLPAAFQRRVGGHLGAGDGGAAAGSGGETALAAIADHVSGRSDTEVGAVLEDATRTALKGLVAQTALQQTAKGLFSAGIRKSAVYSYRKISKRFGTIK